MCPGLCCGGLAATLFIDDGFESAGAQSLDMAINALGALRCRGRVVCPLLYDFSWREFANHFVLVAKRMPAANIHKTLSIPSQI